ncbi:hypothetical protein C7271_19105 [filamentous cyanobacterium CCP5]|nr:hypothetical protein C7271_19105 [filamentous cyanobacterium CCP5]
MDNTQLIQTASSAATPGTAYWIRLTTHNQQALFGNRTSPHLAINETGHILADEWSRLAQKYSTLQLEDWTVMPSSVQGIFILLTDNVQQQNRFTDGTPGQPPRQLSAFVASFKAASATRINLLRNQPGEIIWQRGYQQQSLKDPHILLQARQRLIGTAA